MPERKVNTRLTKKKSLTQHHTQKKKVYASGTIIIIPCRCTHGVWENQVEAATSVFHVQN